MLKNYLTIALRNLRRHKGYSFINIADPSQILGVVFLGRTPPPCTDAADTNDDGQLGMGDVLTLLDHLFGTDSPPMRDPGASFCGPDPTEDDWGDCESSETGCD